MGRTGAINAKVCATKSQWNFLLLMHPIHTMGPKSHVFFAFRNVWVYLEQFYYCTKVGAKLANLVQLMQKFVPRSRV